MDDWIEGWMKGQKGGHLSLNEMEDKQVNGSWMDALMAGRMDGEHGGRGGRVARWLREWVSE